MSLDRIKITPPSFSDVKLAGVACCVVVLFGKHYYIAIITLLSMGIKLVKPT
jgi:hypothetical protein